LQVANLKIIIDKKKLAIIVIFDVIETNIEKIAIVT
jgi:hypothetical protein